MIFWDVNLLVYAFRKDSPFHERARAEIKAGTENTDGFLFSPQTASSFLRLVTNPNIFKEPSPIEEAWGFVDYLETHPLARPGRFDEMAFGIFKHLCLVHRACGNEVPDALLAALAIRYDCAFVTFDDGFARFGGLNVMIIGDTEAGPV